MSIMEQKIQEQLDASENELKELYEFCESLSNGELESHIQQLEYQLREINEHNIGDSDSALTKFVIERNLKVFKKWLNKPNLCGFKGVEFWYSKYTPHIKIGTSDSVLNPSIEQEILVQESFIEEEKRCLDFCLSNPDECCEDEINDRKLTLQRLIEKLNNLKYYIER